jgi:hypothetical protein
MDLKLMLRNANAENRMLRQKIDEMQEAWNGQKIFHSFLCAAITGAVNKYDSASLAAKHAIECVGAVLEKLDEQNETAVTAKNGTKEPKDNVTQLGHDADEFTASEDGATSSLILT